MLLGNYVNKVVWISRQDLLSSHALIVFVHNAQSLKLQLKAATLINVPYFLLNKLSQPGKNSFFFLIVYTQRANWRPRNDHLAASSGEHMLRRASWIVLISQSLGATPIGNHFANLSRHIRSATDKRSSSFVEVLIRRAESFCLQLPPAIKKKFNLGSRENAGKQSTLNYLYCVFFLLNESWCHGYNFSCRFICLLCV